MSGEINLGGVIYISSKQASEVTGYTQDYIGQLARSGAIEGKRISGLWYISEESLKKHKEKADEYKPQPPQKPREAELETSVSFDGKDYVSSQRASKITGYSADYVGQLAREGKVVSRQVGNRWYVDREGIVAHKKRNDQLLAAVQAESVGLRRPEPALAVPSTPQQMPQLHFNYLPEEKPLIPQVTATQRDASESPAEEPELALNEYDEVHSIPILGRS